MNAWIIWTAGFLVVGAAIGLMVGTLYHWQGALWGLLWGGVAAVVCVGIAAGIVQSETRSCRIWAAELGYSGEWTAFTDCLVTLPDGQVVPADQLRYQDNIGENP